jgi:cysteinyl-tRNA synthetase
MSPEEVAHLRGPSGRPVLAYLSIGEAESYRPYWRAEWTRKGGRPAFLGPENPDWKGNFKVRYWLPAWQAIIRGRLEALVATGFDGVYLDIIDAYEFWGPGGEKPERKTAADDMVGFVTSLAESARATRPRFALVPQNGAGLLDAVSPARAALYLDAVDGIGAEDSFFFGEKDEDNRWAPQTETLAALDRFRAAGRVVLAVDYLTQTASARRFVEAARARGFVPYVGRRALDRLVIQP